MVLGLPVPLDSWDSWYPQIWEYWESRESLESQSLINYPLPDVNSSKVDEQLAFVLKKWFWKQQVVVENILIHFFIENKTENLSKNAQDKIGNYWKWKYKNMQIAKESKTN